MIVVQVYVAFTVGAVLGAAIGGFCASTKHKKLRAEIDDLHQLLRGRRNVGRSWQPPPRHNNGDLFQ